MYFGEILIKKFPVLFNWSLTHPVIKLNLNFCPRNPSCNLTNWNEKFLPKINEAPLQSVYNPFVSSHYDCSLYDYFCLVSHK